MAEFGSFSLKLALFLAGYAILIDLMGAWRQDGGLRGSGRNATLACWLCLTAAIVALSVALVKSDFSLKYVAEHTDSTLHWAYKLSALWAGAAGSLLLWLWIQVSMFLLAFWKDDPNTRWFTSVTRAVANLVSCCFLILLLFDQNVFAASSAPVNEGVGLNPPLRHPAMILHPPTLFIGYAGYVIPFAWAITVLGMRATKNRPPLLGRVWYWMMAAWIFLTIGNALGSWWAYEELGWGGFWAWDPVENSSFMPWLIGTALLHSFKKYRPNTKIARWAIFLSLLTFSLCIFGRFLTKYGLVESVHTFGEKGLGVLYLVLLAVVWLLIIGLSLRRLLATQSRMYLTSARGDGVLLLTNWILTILFVVILIGSLFSYLSGLFIKYAPEIMPSLADRLPTQPITLEPEFFNKITSPGGLLLLLLTGLCPYFFRYGWGWGWRTFAGIIFAGVALVFWILSCSLDTPCPEGFTPSLGWGMKWFSSGSPKIPCFIICGFVALNLAVDLLNIGFSKSSHPDQSQKPRRALSWYGARLAHIGVVMIFLGIAGSEGFDIERLERMQVGDVIVIEERGYEIRFDDMLPTRGIEYDTQTAMFTVNKNGEFLTEMGPSWRYYRNFRPTSEPAIRRTLAGDLYLSLTGLEPSSKLINLRVLIKPLINWLWIGCIVLVAGTGLVLVSRRPRRPSPEETGGQTK